MIGVAVVLCRKRNEFSKVIKHYLQDTDKEYMQAVFVYIRHGT